MTALLLLGHGSRDPAGVAEFWRVAEALRALELTVPLGFGFVELAEPGVDEAIDRLVADGADDIVVVPLVLLAAGHLKTDAPAALARARHRHPGVRFRLARDLGIDPTVLSIAEDRIRAAAGRSKTAPTTGDPSRSVSSDNATRTAEPDPRPGVALIGRGSSDPDACADLWKVARLLGDGRGLGMIEPGFAGVATPDVVGALDRLRLLGADTVVVSPFFLFDGVLVRRIGARAAEWAAAHPGITVTIGPHLGPDPRLLNLILERFREAVHGDVRMNCDLCRYRVRLPGQEDQLGSPIPVILSAPRRTRRSPTPPQPRPEPPKIGVEGGFATETPAGVPAVDVRDLRFSYPDGTAALSGVDLRVHAGERVALLGPNGAGKTSLVLHLNGVLRPTSGEIRISGTPVTPRTLAEIRRRVGVVFQDPDDQLFTPTVARDVAFGPANLGLTGQELADRVTEALSYVDLTDMRDRPPHHLSGGQRRRAALASVLSMRPDILVLDEPSANLDPAARRQFADLIKRLDMTTLLVTHDLPYALELCPRSIVIDNGRIVADGPTRELLADTPLMSAHRLELPVGFTTLLG